MSAAQSPEITYTLSIPKPVNHIFEVNITFNGMNDEQVDLILPVWRPGRYVLFDFSSGIIEFNAGDGNGKSFRWEKIDKSEWRVYTSGCTTLSVDYKVYANEFNLRTRGLDYDHAFIDGTSVFMYCEKYRNMPLNLKVNPYADWHVTTGLENKNGLSTEFTAPDYDYFVDCPLEIGNQKDINFDIDGRKHILSFYGSAKYDSSVLINDISKIIREEQAFWNIVPYNKYVFIIHLNKYGGGGTEHINSCVLDVASTAFDTPISYKRFLRLVSHEFFHTWNVKQLRPKGITPYDYTKENYTSELWIAEGGTSYYEKIILARTGLYNPDDFLNDLCKAIHEDRMRPGNKVQSVAESSFDAWVKFWKGTQQSFNTESDYYGKGANVSLILDLEIRHNTNNQESLDGVYKKMYERYPLGTGYNNSDFQKMCEEVNGASMKEFFDDYVYGTKPIDWEKYLSYTGLNLIPEDSTAKPISSLTISQSDNGLIIRDVLPGSPAEDAGLDVGDEIIAFNGERVSTTEDFATKMDRLSLRDTLTLTVFRVDNLMEFSFVLTQKGNPDNRITKSDDPSTIQKKIFESWLGIDW